MDPTPEFDRDATAAKYLPRVQAYARRLAARSPQWGDEVEGEAVVGLVKALRNYRGGDFQTYLMMIVRRRCRKKLKHLRRQAAARPAEVPLQDGDQAARPAAARQELGPDALRVLTPRLRRAVELVFCRGMTHAEAAAVMRVSKAQVGILLHDAAMRLRYGLPEAERAPNLFDGEKP